MLTEKGIARYLNVKNAIAVAISTILTLMTLSIEGNDFEKSQNYVRYLIILFVMYVIMLLIDYAPDIADWMLRNFKHRESPINEVN